MLGLQIVSPVGQTWFVTPHLSGLTTAEGGFETTLGWFGVKWSLSDTSFDLQISSPVGTQGSVALVDPRFSKFVTVDRSLILMTGENQIFLLEGGNHTISVLLQGGSTSEVGQ